MKVFFEPIDQSYIKVIFSEDIAQDIFSSYFTFEVPEAKFRKKRNPRWDGLIRLYNKNTCKLPKGLMLKAYQVCIDLDLIVVNNVDPTDTPFDEHTIDSYLDGIDVTSKGQDIEAYDYQIEALKHVLINKRAHIEVATGGGKSLFCYLATYLLTKKLEGNILIVVPTLDLIHQLWSDFKDYSEFDHNFNAEDIKLIFSGQDKFKDAKITISTYQSLVNLPKDYFEQFDCVITDEAHKAEAKSFVYILESCINAYYKFGMSGSYKGGKVSEISLEGHMGPYKFIVDSKTLRDKEVLSQVEVDCIMLEYNSDVSKQYRKLVKDKLWSYQKEIDFLVGCSERNNLITNLAEGLEGNTIILFKYIEKHGDILLSLIRERLRGTDRNVFYITGDTKKEVRKNVREKIEQEKDCIILANYQLFSTGINIKNLHNAILAHPLKSETTIVQSIGRILRKADNGQSAKMYDIIDRLNDKQDKNYTYQHGEIRAETYIKQKIPYKVQKIAI